MPDPAAPPFANPDWPEAMATVLSCTYSARAGRAIAFGLPTRKHYRIRYNYWAEGNLHTDEMFAERPIAQGSLFPIRYDPDRPHRTQTTSANRTPLLIFGLAGSLVLSLAWLLVMRGCQ